MSTHRGLCVVCGTGTLCSSDTHVLGAGGGCYDPAPPIEFCSLACFKELRERLEKRMQVAKEEYPEWFAERERQ